MANVQAYRSGKEYETQYPAADDPRAGASSDRLRDRQNGDPAVEHTEEGHPAVTSGHVGKLPMFGEQSVDVVLVARKSKRCHHPSSPTTWCVSSPGNYAQSQGYRIRRLSLNSAISRRRLTRRDIMNQPTFHRRVSP